MSKGHDPSVLEGQHEHTLDSKGRLSVPADFRLALQLTENDELIITRHLKERCLLVFWSASWARFREQIENAPAPVATAIKRVICGSARRVRLDRLGRLQVPQVFRRYAGLEGKCLVMGQGNLMEVWSGDLWDRTHGPEAYEDFDLSAFNM